MAVQKGLLFRGRNEAEFEGFHCFHDLYPVTGRGTPYISGLNAGVLRRFFDKTGKKNEGGGRERGRAPTKDARGAWGCRRVDSRVLRRLEAEEVEDAVTGAREVAEENRDVESLAEVSSDHAEDTDGEVSESGHDLGSGAGPDGGAVFAGGDVPRVVQGFDGQVVPDPVEKSLRVSPRQVYPAAL